MRETHLGISEKKISTCAPTPRLHAFRTLLQ